MKSRRKKITIAIAGILLVTLILNAICTWGICFHHTGGFTSIPYIFEDIFTEKQTGTITMRDNSTNPTDSIYIPGVFYIYRIDPPPYMIQLNIYDESESLEKISIELISIEYVDGQKINHNVIWERKFNSGGISRYVNSKLVRIPVRRLNDKLPVTVDRRQSCKIKFVGYFVNKEGSKISFDTAEYFEYEAHEWRIYPLAGSF
jgi:hypothetical protein